MFGSEESNVPLLPACSSRVLWLEQEDGLIARLVCWTPSFLIYMHHKSCQRLMHHTIVLTFSFNEVSSKKYEICCRKRLLSIREEKLATVLHQHMNQCYTCCRCYTCKPRRCRNSWTFRAFLLGKLTAWLHGQMMVTMWTTLYESLSDVNDSVGFIVQILILWPFTEIFISKYLFCSNKYKSYQ